jgi:hypothetical protein
MEAIGKAIGTPTRDLNLSVKKLLATEKIRTRGEASDGVFPSRKRSVKIDLSL